MQRKKLEPDRADGQNTAKAKQTHEFASALHEFIGDTLQED